MKDRVKPDGDPYRQTFEQAALGIAHVGPDGRWLRVNPQLCAILGYSEEEMLARNLEDFIHPDDLPEELAQVRRMFAGERDAYTAERRYRRKGGLLVWIRLTASVARTPSGDPAYLIALIEDISERKRREEQEKADLAATTIFETLPDAFLTLDRTWRILSLNSGAARLLSRTAQTEESLTSVGRYLWDAFPEAVGTTLYRECHRALAEGVVVECEAFHQPSRGWLEIRAYPSQAGLTVYLRDITERKQRAEEQALLLIEAQWNAAADHALLRAILASVTEGRLRLCNSPNDLPTPLKPIGDPLTLSAQSLWTARRRTQELAAAQGFLPERWQDLVMAVGAAAVNAVTQAGAGEIKFYVGPNGTVQVWIEDTGPGIAADYLRAPSDLRGGGAAWVPQQEFWMLIKAADRAFLLTGPSGTTVVLEQERDAPEPEPEIAFGLPPDPGPTIAPH